MEIKKVFLSSNIKEVLLSATETAGYIAGWDADTGKFCVALSSKRDFFLSGLEINGIYCILNDIPSIESEILRICEEQYENLKVEIEHYVMLFACKIDEENDFEIIAKSYSPYYNTLSNLEIEYVDSNSAVLLRAKGSVPCYFEVVSDPDILKENIDQAIERVQSTFQKKVAVFFLRNSKLIRHSLADQDTDSSETLKQLLKSIQDEEFSGKSKAKKTSKKKLPIELNILIQSNADAILDNSFNHSVVIHCQRREFQCASLQIPIDVLIVCQESFSLHNVYCLFLDAIEKQLIQMNKCLIKYATGSQIDTPTPYHFYPDFWDFPITIIYPFSETDDELESYRKELHRHLLLPLDRPFLKKLNSCDFSLSSGSGHLYNPHEGLSSSGVIGGKCAIVQGTYSYHHYMQDHMDDNGWGCAYRSLQTIVSWFRNQGYTEKNIPSHEEIQKALVEVGDKPESFIGSKKWIGSQEVAFCLDHLIGVQSKIIFVSSGAEMASKGRELYNHFSDQGTPVMIGGGVLAHTILGVDFNQNTGELKFLILDPHYTGKEDINIILNKGWCGWKDVKFWNPTAFYNLCLPQRPKQI